MKWVVLLVVIAGLGGGTWWWRNHNGDIAAASYDSTTVERNTITVTISASGTMNPVTTVQVGSQVSGRIQSLFADYNSVVTAGQVVAVLEPSPFLTRVRQSSAALAKTKASALLAKMTFDRQALLAKQNIASAADLDTAQANHEQASAEVQQAEANLENANIDLAHATIYSPVDGVVLTRAVDVGQTVAASLQAPTLFTIASDLTKMEIQARVDEADVGQVAEGQPVAFTVDAFPLQSFTGMVRQVRNSPQIVQNVVTYDTIIAVDNSSMVLKPGMTANTTIIITSVVDVVCVPNAALRFKPPVAVAVAKTVGQNGRRFGDGQGRPSGGPEGASGRSHRSEKSRVPRQTMYVLDGGALKAVGVVPGLTDGALTQIVAGLDTGAVVVTSIATSKSVAQAKTQVNPFAPTSGRGGGGRR